jgi:hypothetical protein
MTPHEYLELICEPNLREFGEDPTSVRRAWSAASSLFHYVDCLATHRGEEVSKVRAAIEKQFPQLSVLADVANTTKHFRLKRGGNAGLSASDFEVNSGAAFSDGSYFSDGSSFSDAPDVVRIILNGHPVDLLHLCRDAIRFFQDMTHR